MSSPPRILIEGRPGSGKTTVARRVAAQVRAAGVPVAGFLTGEIREGRRRVGFGVEALGGDEATLAHVDLPGPPRVGKYGVDLAAFERVALPAIVSAREEGVAIVDELGRMELASERFREAIAELLERPVALVATVHAHRHPFTDALKRRRGIQLVRLSRENRDELPARIAKRLT